MSVDFKNISYLKCGNHQQILAFDDIQKLAVFEKLKKYTPILTGTIPIEIDIPDSDLDIICYCKNHAEFSKILMVEFGDEDGFHIQSTKINDEQTTIANFRTENFEIEIFGQNVSSENQNAYKHMLAEHWILKQQGVAFKEDIIKLKSSGLKTEPAFAKLLGLPGDPYISILKIYASQIALINK